VVQIPKGAAASRAVTVANLDYRHYFHQLLRTIDGSIVEGYWEVGAFVED